MKSKRLALIILTLFISFITFVAAQNILNMIIVNASSCSETDKGLDYFTKGSMTGRFSWTNSSNQTQRHNGTFIDICENSTVLIEGVCGSSIDPTLSHLAGVAHIDCKTTNLNGVCIDGRCASRPIALWTFDEGSGSTTKDLAGNGNAGTLSGTKWTSDSRSGFALEFDGINSLINIKKTASVDITKEVTLEAWVKRKSTTDGMIISKNGPYYLSIRGNKIEGGVYANDGRCSRSCTTPGKNTWTFTRGTTDLKKDIWYNLKLTYDGKNVKVYVDNKLEGSTQKIGEMPQVSQRVHIGWGDPGQNQYFTGILDDVAIYDFPKIQSKHFPSPPRFAKLFLKV